MYFKLMLPMQLCYSHFIVTSKTTFMFFHKSVLSVDTHEAWLQIYETVHGTIKKLDDFFSIIYKGLLILGMIYFSWENFRKNKTHNFVSVKV